MNLIKFITRLFGKPNNPVPNSSAEMYNDNGSDVPEDGNAFMNYMIQSTIANTEKREALQQQRELAELKAEKYPPDKPSPTTTQAVIGASTQSQQIPATVNYFTDNGIEYKIENNILYKKDWQNVNSEKHINFRIINGETGKQIKNEKYVIQELVWTPVKQN